MSPRTVFVFLLLSSVVVLDNVAGAKLIQQSIFDIGLGLFYHFRDNVTDVPENLIASPLGLSLGLGLIELAASSRSSVKQLIVQKVFHWEEGEVELHRQLTAIQEVLKSSYQHKPKEEVPLQFQISSRTLNKGKVADLEDVEVNIQCAIFHRDGLNVSKLFRTVTENGYDSQFVVLNESLTTPQRQAIINEWAQNATKSLIREFPAPEKFDLLLANTVYFEGDWVEPFANEYTRRGVFKTTPNHHNNVTYMLGQLEEVPYYEDGSFQMIRLAYKTRQNDSQNIGMFVVLPRDGRELKQIIDELSFDSFRNVLKNKMTLQTVNVKLPKVKLNQRIQVKEVLDKIQDRTNRQWARAMNSTRPVKSSIDEGFMLSDFIQDVVLEVNEKGTRAAALTGGYINYDGFKKNFRCDRPYLMLIYDNQHDVVLFWASIYRPRVD